MIDIRPFDTLGNADLSDTFRISAVPAPQLWPRVPMTLKPPPSFAFTAPRASSLQDSARSLASLLEVAPARPLLVRPDGRVDQ